MYMWEQHKSAIIPVKKAGARFLTPPQLDSPSIPFVTVIVQGVLNVKTGNEHRQYITVELNCLEQL
jgi:hypothetical protein